MTNDPRDMVGQNPTGRERKSSSRRRGKAARQLDAEISGIPLEGTPPGHKETRKERKTRQMKEALEDPDMGFLPPKPGRI